MVELAKEGTQRASHNKNENAFHEINTVLEYYNRRHLETVECVSSCGDDPVL
jgi:hypothetical protein